MKRRCFGLVAAALLLGCGNGAAAELSARGSSFVLDNQPTFLLGISYYGALGAPREFIERDLTDIQKCGFNWLRIWATWSAFGNDVSAIDKDGNAREPYMSKLKWLLAECDRRGLVVDITLTRGEGRLGHEHVPKLQAHRHAVRVLARELRAWRNWYLDLANEHNLKGRRKFVPLHEARQLRDAVKGIDPIRLVTISFVGDLSKDALRSYLFDVQVDFISPHRRRGKSTAAETHSVTQRYLQWMKELRCSVPVHYQEPFRRDFNRCWQPTLADFLADLKGAVAGGAAGWCFHNGDNRCSPGGRPRRSFDMRIKRLFDQLDQVELQVVRQVRRSSINR